MLNINDYNFCIVGDLNARTGDMQQLEDDMFIDSPSIAANRKSYDKKQMLKDENC